MGAATQNAQRTSAKPVAAAGACSHLTLFAWIALGAALGAAVVVTTVPSLGLQQRALWRHGEPPSRRELCCAVGWGLLPAALARATSGCMELRSLEPAHPAVEELARRWSHAPRRCGAGDPRQPDANCCAPPAGLLQRLGR